LDSIEFIFFWYNFFITPSTFDFAPNGFVGLDRRSERCAIPNSQWWDELVSSYFIGFK